MKIIKIVFEDQGLPGQKPCKNHIPKWRGMGGFLPEAPVLHWDKLSRRQNKQPRQSKFRPDYKTSNPTAGFSKPTHIYS